ncbi:Double-stranded RNA-binding protein [Quillaja saponaria]|uniref:Double-stranded RNA-binding protein n=1 Tax=Quillaja saponaria TaxID=32244 RepID=A0AAD7LLJ1_QUISA|nr:Double-stranded RNA-binding protein [Quillaja saponaria]
MGFAHLFDYERLVPTISLASTEFAYLHFTSPPPASPDLHCQVKNQLQNYARSKNLDPPIFSSKSKGPSHATRFKASVTVGGRSFDSPAFFNTLKEAEQAAAKIALLSFSLDSFQRGDSRLYKSLLHELAQREGFCIPTYKTTRAGASHMPIFLSTVEVDGRIFHGEEAKSKKQAELNAAVVAYTVLKECGLNQNRQVTSPNDPQHEAVEPIHGGPVVAPLAMNEENEVPHKEEIIKNRNLSPSELAPASSKLSPFSELSHPDLSSLSISESTLENNLVTTSYLLCGRFRVYTCFPDDAFPEGTTVVPVSENRWMAVSLRFPNENCY